MVADAELLFIAEYGRIQTGCSLRAVSTETGTTAWSVPLTGIGSIGHSKYANRVELRLMDGAPTVFGWESGGRYVEVRDRHTGALIHNRKLDDSADEPVRMRPIAEPLHRELVEVAMKRAASASIQGDDFLVRHNLASDGVSTADVVAALTGPVAALDGLPMREPGVVLRVSLDAEGTVLARTEAAGGGGPRAGEGHDERDAAAQNEATRRAVEFIQAQGYTDAPATIRESEQTRELTDPADFDEAMSLRRGTLSAEPLCVRGQSVRGQGESWGVVFTAPGGPTDVGRLVVIAEDAVHIEHQALRADVYCAETPKAAEPG
jgi:hypothetical protein